MKSWITRALVLAMLLVSFAGLAIAQETHPSGNPAVAANESKNAAPPAEARTEASLVLPDLSSVSFLGYPGSTLLKVGLFVCLLGMLFGFVMYVQLKNLPVHRSMREISELIYETCKTYLTTQGKFILLLEVFIGAIMVIYFGWLRHFPADRVVITTTTPPSYSLATTQGGRVRLELKKTQLPKALAKTLDLVPMLRGAHVIRSWSGIDGQMPDHIPVIGFSSTTPNLVHAFAYNARNQQGLLRSLTRTVSTAVSVPCPSIAGASAPSSVPNRRRVAVSRSVSNSSASKRKP